MLYGETSSSCMEIQLCLNRISQPSSYSAHGGHAFKFLKCGYEWVKMMNRDFLSSLFPSCNETRNIGLISIEWPLNLQMTKSRTVNVQPI